jgi:undecaprenyl-diphosphatase
VIRRLTHLGDAAVTIGAALLTAALGEWRLGAAMLIANALSHVPVRILKRLVARPRPSDAFGRPLALVPLPDPFSFPSGHAAAITAVTTTATIAHPWLGPLVLPVAALVSYSRVALRVHHASDVLAGMGLGLAGALAARALL